MTEKSLIEDVADNIERLFREMWPYQDQQAPMKSRENEVIRCLVRDLTVNEEDMQKLPEAEQSRIPLVRENELAAQKRLDEAVAKVREISGRIADEQQCVGQALLRGGEEVLPAVQLAPADRLLGGGQPFREIAEFEA